MFKADDFGFKVISSHLFDHQGPDLFVPINLISWLFFFMLIVKTSLSYLRSIESFLSRFLIGLKFRADFLPLISLHLLYVLIKYRLFCWQLEAFKWLFYPVTLLTSYISVTFYEAIFLVPQFKIVQHWDRGLIAFRFKVDISFPRGEFAFHITRFNSSIRPFPLLFYRYLFKV